MQIINECKLSCIKLSRISHNYCSGRMIATCGYFQTLRVRVIEKPMLLIFLHILERWGGEERFSICLLEVSTQGFGRSRLNNVGIVYTLNLFLTNQQLIIISSRLRWMDHVRGVVARFVMRRAKRMALVFIVIGACAGWSTDIFKDPLSFANKSKYPTHAHWENSPVTRSLIPCGFYIL